jgi:Ni,Fe-hydrogenase III small subunit/ferredoxin
MKWLFRGIKKRTLTTGYPAKKPTYDEVPEIGLPVPYKCADFTSAKNSCPTGAIGDAIDAERCIFCGKCEEYRFRKSRTVELAEVKRTLPFSKSIHVFVADAGSCNACNREVEMLNNPFYDFHRLGIFFTPTPKHADVLLILGYPTERMINAILEAYSIMPEPKVVVAVGTCAISGGIFGDSGINAYMDVDAKIPGCPPPPIAILHGLLKVSGR